MIKTIDSCRLCGGKDIHDLFTFGLVAPANNYIKPEDVNKEEIKFSLTPCRCRKCYHIQIRETVDKELLFSNYLYASSTSGSLSKYFEQYTKEIVDYLGLKPENGYILDLGANDGVTLQHFKNRGFEVLGIEPAKNLSKIANDKGINTINEFFNEITAQDILEKYGYPQLIISNNTYAHLEEHHSFTEGVKLLLNNKNCFVFENASLLETIKGLYFDQFYHDHLGYYWTFPIMKYFNSKNLGIFNIQKTPIQGGSIRVFVGKSPKKVENSVERIYKEELDYGLDKEETYQQFWANLSNIKTKFKNLIDKYILENKTVCCYGCPAKFALFSKFFELNNKNVKYVVEDSKFKQNLFAPESKIKIVDKQYFIDNPTDICIISAWNFISLITENNKQYQGVWLNPFGEI